MDEFVNLAAQERFDRPGTVEESFQLKLRSFISVVAEGLPITREAVAAAVAILEPQ